MKRTNRTKGNMIAGAGLVVVGIALLNSNQLIGMLFIGFGLGYNTYPLVQKAFAKR